MPFGIDIQEDEILSWGHGILETLLRDHTTEEYIIRATNDYAERGETNRIKHKFTEYRLRKII